MKNSNKSNLIIGISLLAISAFFTISLIILPINLAFQNQNDSNIFLTLGTLLYSAYGFCSILIPVFLLIAGLSCFATIWTSKKTMFLITAIIPFFTAVVTEKICRSIINLGNTDSNLVKILIALFLGIILIIIEFIGAAFTAEIINQKLFHSPRKYKPLIQPHIQTTQTNTIVEQIKDKTSNNDDDFTVEVVEEEVEQENPTSVLSQEEFAALMPQVQEEETEVEELEWTNLPKAPETLPEDYIETDEDLTQTDITEQEHYSEYDNSFKQNNLYSNRISLSDEQDDSTIVASKKDSFSIPKTEEEPSNFHSNILLQDNEPSISPDFYDVDMTNEEIQDEDLEQNDDFKTFDEDTQTDDDFELNEEEFDDEQEIEIQKPSKTIDFLSASANAFSQMDQDIKNKNASIEITQSSTKPIEEKNKYGKKGPYIIPTDLLTAYQDDKYWIIDEATKQASVNLTQTLSEFNIDAQIIGIKKGPVVTMFELLPAPGVKLSKIVALQDNIALSLAASSVRIVAPIPGKQAVGIEVPNKKRSVVGFREIIEMDFPEWNSMTIPVVLGKDILGKAQLMDLVKTPHMLIAGATGSGKSVCVNSLILSILYKRSYRDVKLILVDPKVVELKLYNNIPHLLTPVITEPKKALQALQYCLCEMERRYALLDSMGVRDISSYNKRIKEREICTEKLPYIIVIIDEFADLMATSGKELENIVARLTAMSRAVGIHLVLATQRPSVNVITGLIKANIPTRIAFMVSSRTDSNIILDTIGAEKLLGRGDMLYTSQENSFPIRVQGTFVSDQEVENTVEAVKEYGEPDYIDEEIFIEDDEGSGENVDLFGNPYDEDPLYDQALEIVVQAGKASASYIQRRLKIGYNRAARLVEEMEERGIVGPANGSKPREIIHIP